MPSFARGSISLPDHAVLIRELKNLERRTSRSGKDSIQHPPELHDDHCSAIFGALRSAVRTQNTLFTGFLDGRSEDDDDRATLAARGMTRSQTSWPRPFRESTQRGAIALLEDEMRTPPARHQAALDHASKVMKPALQQSDTVRTRLNAETASLKIKVAAPAPVRDALGSEIRTAIRNLKPSERSKTMLSAARQGDAIAAAVLNAPSMLSE